MKIAALALMLLMSLVSMARSDIDVKPQYDANEPIRATVTITGVPEGAKLRGSFSISGGSYLPTGIENVYDCWAGEGKHSIVAQGVWVLTKDVTVEGQTFPVLLDFGQYHYEKSITVGEGPSPVPPPDPVPPGKRVAVILEESKDKTAAQALLWAQLLKQYKPEQLQILDDDLPAAQKYVSLSKLSARPVLLVLTEQGALIREVSVPSSVAGVKQEIER